MSTTKPPDPMCASTNRYDDLQPYCSFIYREDPGTWGSIFPWEFPQNGTREQEEEFIRRYFSDHEIHMQGGATGEGAGFRFLKQVWYCIALWNIEHRIPLFTNWWLEKPSSIELMNDPNIQPFLFHDDVKASTFFPDELAEYGEKFLTIVIPYLQQTVKNMLKEQETTKKPSLVIDTRGMQHHSRAQIDGVSEPEVSALSVPSVIQGVQSAPGAAPNMLEGIPELPTQAPQSAPILQQVPMQQALPDKRAQIKNQGRQSQSEQAENAAVKSTLHTGSQPNPRQPENTEHKNFSNRGEYHHFNRQQMALQQLHGQSQPSSSMFEPPTSKRARDHPRRSSEALPDFMPVNPQGGKHSSKPWQSSFVPGQFSHYTDRAPSTPNTYQNGHQNMRHGGLYGEPQRYFSAAISDRSNEQQVARSFSAEYAGQSFDLSLPVRGNHRRDSQGSRGGKSRGMSGYRGRGRGRNSFTSADHSRPTTYNENMPPGSWPYPPSNGHLPGLHRENAIYEKNWRTGNAFPQAREQYTMNAQEPSLPNLYPVPGYMVSHPHQQLAVYATRPPRESEIERVPIHGGPFHDNPAFPPMHRIDQGKSNLPDLRFATEEQFCGKDWIGSKCVYADRLIVFDVPTRLDAKVLFDMFSDFGTVVNASRSSRFAPKIGVDGEQISNAIITFATAAMARHCLMTRPEKWLGGRPLRVEVSKSLWDPTHKAFIFNQDTGISHVYPDGRHNNAARNMSILKRPEDILPPPEPVSSIPHVSSEMYASTDTNTTPTPSYTTTAKKKKPKKSKAAKHREQELLRKASITLMVEQQAQMINDSGISDASSTVTPVEQNEGKDKPCENLTALRDSLTIDSGHFEKRDSLPQPAAMTEEQVTSRTRTAREPVVVIRTGLSGVTRSSSTLTEVQSCTELPFTDDDVVVARLPLMSSAARAARASEELVVHEQEPHAANDPKMTGVQPHKSAELRGGHKDSNATSEPDHIGETKDVADPTPLELGSGTKNDDTMQSQVDASKEDATAPAAERSAMLQVPVQKTSAQDRVTSTPAHSYFTAPSTPAVDHLVSDVRPPSIGDLLDKVFDDTKAANIETALGASATDSAPIPDSAPSEPDEANAAKQPQKVRFTKLSQPKRVDKAKGPAQTESFSLFGKKKEHKPKAAKKGSLKGKPKEMDMTPQVMGDNGSATTSRAASTSIPATAAASEKADAKDLNYKHGGEVEDRKDSIIANRSTKKGKKRKSDQNCDGQTTKESTVVSIASEEPTPSKRKDGLRGLLSNIFGGGQHSTSTDVHSASRSSSPSKKAPPEGVKSPEQPKKTADIQQTDLKDISPGSIDNNKHAVSLEATVDEAKSVSQVEPQADQTESFVASDECGAAGPMTGAVEVGLGISNISTKASHTAGPASTKKATKRKRKTREHPDDAVNETEEQSRPYTSSSGQSTSTDANLIAQIGDVVDDVSEVSSGTMGRQTPTSETQSPTMSTSGRKLPSRPNGTTHLVEEKSPRWKQKRRNLSSRNSDVFEMEADEYDKPDEVRRPLTMYVYTGDGPIVECIDTGVAVDGSSQNGSVSLAIDGQREIARYFLRISEDADFTAEEDASKSTERITEVTDDDME